MYNNQHCNRPGAFWRAVPVGVLAVAWVLSLRAAPVDEQNVRAAVQTWVRYVTAEAKPHAVIAHLERHVVDGEPLAYIAHLDGGGFCLCGADDVSLPVYLYCPRGAYDARVPDFQAVLDEIVARTRALRSLAGGTQSAARPGEDSLSGRAQYWQALIEGRPPIRASDGPESSEPSLLELPLTCQWGQRSPYNDQCPVLTPPDEHTVVGCNAIAIAQIMYYWRWPWSGVGSDSIGYAYRWRSDWDEEPLAANPDPAGLPWRGRLDWTSANGGRLRMTGFWDGSIYSSALGLNTNSAYRTALANLYNRLFPTTVLQTADFGATTYNWSVLQDRHTDPVDDGDPEVARLCYHVAVAVDTSFGVDGSGSDLYRVPAPLSNYFRYDSDVRYTNPRDVNVMTEEIQWLRPFSLAGGPPGHAWVVFGYNKGTDPHRQFKMNMGWDGGSDGWYTLDQVPLNIISNHNHLTHIAPAGVVRFVGASVAGDGSPANPYRNIEEALASAPNGTTLIFKAGSDNTFAAPLLRIDRPLTLKGAQVSIYSQ